MPLESGQGVNALPDSARLEELVGNRREPGQGFCCIAAFLISIATRVEAESHKGLLRGVIVKHGAAQDERHAKKSQGEEYDRGQEEQSQPRSSCEP